MFDKCKEYKKVILISVILVIATSLALYFSPTRKVKNVGNKQGTTQSSGKTTSESNGQSTGATAEQKQAEQKQQEAQKVNKDATKTETLKQEKEVIDGQIYVQNNIARATMIIKDDVSEAAAKALADKYAKQLKEQYKDMKVNVQAVQKGKNVADITIEK